MTSKPSLLDRVSLFLIAYIVQSFLVVSQLSASVKVDTPEIHKENAIRLLREGDFQRAEREIQRAIEISYAKGMEDAELKNNGMSGRYILLSIATGLMVSAIVILVFLRDQIEGSISDISARIKTDNFIRNISISLDPELRSKASEFIKSKERLRKVISKERDPAIKAIASSILPKLDEMTKQALLLIELQQNLLTHTRQINYYQLESDQRNCHHKLEEEKDPEAIKAIEYQLRQLASKQESYKKAISKIRMCDAMLNGMIAKIDSTLLDLMSIPSIMVKKQEFFERMSTELEEEINLTKKATEDVGL